MKALHDERGQTLVFVLLFVMAFSLVVTAMLGLASTSLNASRQTTALARQREAGDAGAEYGIQQVKGGSVAPFGSASTTLTVPSTVNGESVSVTIAQRNATTLSITGPSSLTVNTDGDYQAVLNSDTGANNALPYGAAWSATGPAGFTLDQAGRFRATVAGAYTLEVTLGNVSATKAVTVNP